MKTGLFPSEQKIINSYFKKDMHILDLGYGTGRTTVYLSHLDNKIVGIDYSESMIKMARERLPMLDFKVANAKKLDFEFLGFYGNKYSSLIPISFLESYTYYVFRKK